MSEVRQTAAHQMRCCLTLRNDELGTGAVVEDHAVQARVPVESEVDVVVRAIRDLQDP